MDICALCGSQRTVTRQWSYSIPLPSSERIGPSIESDGGVVFPPHRHVWLGESTFESSSWLLGGPEGEGVGDYFPPHYGSTGALFLLRSRDRDGLRPIERGQGWIDIMVGSETPAARAILAAQPPGDVERLRKELSDPRWQLIIGGYRQLPVPAKEPAAVYWRSLPMPATTQGAVE